jgi:hypothetical protein
LVSKTHNTIVTPRTFFSWKAQFAVATAIMQYIYNGKIKKESDDIYYKVTDSEGKCKGFQYEVGETYLMPEDKIELCRSGFHCCAHPIQCLVFYDFLPTNRYFEVKILGTKIQACDSSHSPKCVTNIMKIEKEISYMDWLELCTVTVESPFLREEKKYEKGWLQSEIEYDLNGKKRYESVYNSMGNMIQSREFYPNGNVRKERLESDTDPNSCSCVKYYENEIIKETKILDIKSGTIIHKTYDKYGVLITEAERKISR